MRTENDLRWLHGRLIELKAKFLTEQDRDLVWATEIQIKACHSIAKFKGTREAAAGYFAVHVGKLEQRYVNEVRNENIRGALAIDVELTVYRWLLEKWDASVLEWAADCGDPVAIARKGGPYDPHRN